MLMILFKKYYWSSNKPLGIFFRILQKLETLHKSQKDKNHEILEMINA